jgi:hydrogenase maturation protease
MKPAPQARRDHALLVIGYGNTLRRDDGVGPRVADTLETLDLPGVSTLNCALLTPETAEPVSRACAVIFVDATVDSTEQVQLRKLTPADSSQILAHAADPTTILALARDVFGQVPEAWLLPIPVADLGLGDQLSTLAQAGFDTALRQLIEFAQNWLAQDTSAA